MIFLMGKGNDNAYWVWYVGLSLLKGYACWDG